MSYLIEGQRPFPALDTQNNPIVVSETITPGYFQAMRTPLLRGRDFTDDDDARRPRVVIVSENMARALWRGQDAIGKRLQLDSVPAGTPESQRWSTVVGVVGDIRYRGVTDERPDLYEPYSQATDAAPHVIIRSEAELAPLVSAVRAVAHRIHPQAQIDAVEPVRDVVARATASWTLNMWMFSALGATGLLLAALGLYGVLAYAVVERRRELAIRLALGATPLRLCFAVLRRGIVLTFSGLVAGLAIARLGAGAAERIVYGVRPLQNDLAGLVCLTLLAVAALAAYLPARRVTAVDPATVLRSE
jgi:hypothetical protein